MVPTTPSRQARFPDVQQSLGKARWHDPMALIGLAAGTSRTYLAGTGTTLNTSATLPRASILGVPAFARLFLPAATDVQATIAATHAWGARDRVDQENALFNFM